MSEITHDEQRQKWNEEHATPFALKQMDARKGSGALKPFVEFLERQGKDNLVGGEL